MEAGVGAIHPHGLQCKVQVHWSPLRIQTNWIAMATLHMGVRNTKQNAL
jgi:hypothetical protein